ncbi:MAG: class I SAM-dependent methyltransferase [Actinobacteria bacterium]|nr:class I SAM-dependent methyltransferase [Actinomycetota bacterium]
MSRQGRIAGSYGVDAPYVPVWFLVVGGIALVVGFVLRGIALWIGVAIAVVMFVEALIYLNTTLRGKFTAWRTIVADLRLSGKEQVLDVGCGRGLVLITAAQQLTTGTAVGVDIWSSHDQSGNAEASTIANAEASGVTERVRIETGDMMELPFEDDSFDVVLTSAAVHNLQDAADRHKALAEMVRVARPGSPIRIVDIAHISDYEKELKELKCLDVTVKHLGFRFWYGNPFVAGRLVAGRAP